MGEGTLNSRKVLARGGGRWAEAQEGGGGGADGSDSGVYKLCNSCRVSSNIFCILEFSSLVTLSLSGERRETVRQRHYNSQQALPPPSTAGSSSAVTSRTGLNQCQPLHFPGPAPGGAKDQFSCTDHSRSCVIGAHISTCDVIGARPGNSTSLN